MHAPLILIIDDDEKVRYSLAMILEKEGFRVRTAGGGRASLEWVYTGNFDLIFLDLSLPDIDGFALLPLIRQKHPDLPILILTATPAQYTEAEAAGLSIQGYFTKPIDPAVILERVRGILMEHPS